MGAVCSSESITRRPFERRNVSMGMRIVESCMVWPAMWKEYFPTHGSRARVSHLADRDASVDSAQADDPARPPNAHQDFQRTGRRDRDADGVRGDERTDPGTGRSRHADGANRWPT